MKNLNIYNRLKSVPAQFLKTIQAGRLKGMSDIKPQWRILKLTEEFGECGFGWKIQNLKFEYQNVNENEIVCNCHLEFLYKKDDIWSDPIPATGGSKLCTLESKGIYVSDEAEKMAYTDAISVATKMIGLASDIYMGIGGKYDSNNAINPEQQNEKPWLNKDSENYYKVLDALTNGKATIAQVESKYKLSKELKEELIKAQA